MAGAKIGACPALTRARARLATYPACAPLDSAAHEILDGLNHAQREAVTHDEGPLLIVAGAGTGKTTVLTRRIAYLIASAAPARRRSSRSPSPTRPRLEMEERVDQLVPYGYADVEIATFHAFGDRLLREHALEIGLKPDFRVLSRAEQVIFLRDRLFELPLDALPSARRPDPPPPGAHQRSSAGQGRGHLAGGLPAVRRAAARGGRRPHPDDAERARLAAASRRSWRATYATYQELMAREGVVDFGDQIVLALRLLRERPHVLAATSGATATSWSTSSRTRTTPSSSW